MNGELLWARGVRPVYVKEIVDIQTLLPENDHCEWLRQLGQLRQYIASSPTPDILLKNSKCLFDTTAVRRTASRSRLTSAMRPH